MEEDTFLTLPKQVDGFFHLTKRYSSLYQKTNYLTDLALVQNRIVEWDLKAANLSALRASGKISSDVLDRLRDVDKKTREIRVGMMIRADKEIGKLIKKGIAQAREMLFRSNLIQSQEVVAIKNDAVYLAGRKLKHTKFGFYEFLPKNTYSLFMRLDKLELYYDGRNNRLDIKGLSQAETDPDQQKGMVKFLCTVFKYYLQGRRSELNRYLIQFSEDYKSKVLPVEYYKELANPSVYRTVLEISQYQYNLTTAGEEDKEMINGVYNYNRFVIPMIQAFLR